MRQAAVNAPSCDVSAGTRNSQHCPSFQGISTSDGLFASSFIPSSYNMWALDFSLVCSISSNRGNSSRLRRHTGGTMTPSFNHVAAS